MLRQQVIHRSRSLELYIFFYRRSGVVACSCSSELTQKNGRASRPPLMAASLKFVAFYWGMIFAGHSLESPWYESDCNYDWRQYRNHVNRTGKFRNRDGTGTMRNGIVLESGSDWTSKSVKYFVFVPVWKGTGSIRTWPTGNRDGPLFLKKLFKT